MVRAGHSIPVLPDDPQVDLPASLGVRCRDARGVDIAWDFFRGHTPPRRGLAPVDINAALGFIEAYRTNARAADVNCDRSVDPADAIDFIAYLTNSE